MEDPSQLGASLRHCKPGGLALGWDNLGLNIRYDLSNLL